MFRSSISLHAAEWLLTDDQLKNEATSLEKNRRNLTQWLKHREQRNIEPIIGEFGEFELLELGLLQGACSSEV